MGPKATFWPPVEGILAHRTEATQALALAKVENVASPLGAAQDRGPSGARAWRPWPREDFHCLIQALHWVKDAGAER